MLEKKFYARSVRLEPVPGLVCLYMRELCCSQNDRQTDRQTDKKTDRQTYKINDHIIPHMLVIIISMHMEFMALFASVARQNHQI